MIEVIALVDPYPGTDTGGGGENGFPFSDSTFFSDGTGWNN